MRTAPRGHGSRHPKKMRSATLPRIRREARLHRAAPWCLAHAHDVPGSSGLPQGFYEWMDRAPSERSWDDAKLTRLFRESFELSDHTDGSPRVWHDLRAMGESCVMNRVIRLVRLAKLQARHKRRRLPGYAGSRLENPIARIHLKRDF